MADENKGLMTTALNPSDHESMPAAMMKLLRDHNMDTNGCLPAIVESYDRSTNTATVTPVIHRVTVDNKKVPRQSISGINVLALGAGGFVVNFPVKKGDLGWLHASDRDLDSFKKGLSAVHPDTCRTHSFEDGIFVPDIFRKYTIQGEHADEMVVSSIDGNNRVAIGHNRVKVAVGSTSLELVAGKIIMVTGGLLEVQSASTKFSGDVEVGGNATIKGTTTMVGAASAEGKDISSHVHRENGTGSDTDPMKN